MALVIACAIRIPFAPSFSACSTSFLECIPAPQSIGMFLILCVVFVIISGFASDTEILPPISSGGSIAIMSGLNFDIFTAISGVLTHTIDIILSVLSFCIVFFISSNVNLCSE